MLFTHYLKITLYSIAVLSTINASAQVTIGSPLIPNKGALLDLKQSMPDANNATSTRGLLLPRVNLTTFSSLSDIISDSPITSDINARHTGLLVYNVKEKGALCKGVHSWNGSEWIPMTLKVETIIDMEGNIYPIRKFGNAGYWMIQNLRSTYNSVIPQGTLVKRLGNGTDNASKLYYYPKDETTFEDNPEYGLIYSWAAATNNTPNDQIIAGAAGTTPSTVQGICPDGWVLPSDYDWSQLEKEIATYPELYSTNSGTSWDDSYNNGNTVFRPASSVNGHGKTMKSVMNVSGILLATNGLSNIVCEDDFKGGFSGYLMGLSASATSYGSQAYMWSSSTINANSSSWFRALTNSSAGVLRSTLSRYYTLGVRCKMK